MTFPTVLAQKENVKSFVMDLIAGTVINLNHSVYYELIKIISFIGLKKKCNHNDKKKIFFLIERNIEKDAKNECLHQ